jgi:hypothetical protein
MGFGVASDTPSSEYLLRVKLANGAGWMNLRGWVDETLAEATGREYRDDPVLPHTGGPAGNALLTAWTGLILLALFIVELGTLLDLGRFLNWHVVVGVLLVPPALLKTGSTGWRILGYYTRRTPYRRAGPPPLPLRLLGPWVVLGTLAVLGSGLALIAFGPQSSRTGFLTLFGYHVDAVGVHKAAVVAWAAVVGLHTSGRLIPALRIVTASRRRGLHVPGGIPRLTLLITTLLVAAIAAAMLLGLANPWLTGGLRLHHR